MRRDEKHDLRTVIVLCCRNVGQGMCKRDDSDRSVRLNPRGPIDTPFEGTVCSGWIQADSEPLPLAQLLLLLLLLLLLKAQRKTVPNQPEHTNTANRDRYEAGK